MKIIVVGGVAAGASAAVKARRVNEEAEIIIFEKGPYVSFANCGLPYYVGGDIKGEGNLLLVTPQLFKDRFNIDVRVNHEVLKILPEEKAVEVQNEEGVFREGYDKLILAPGSKPVVPKLPGIELPGVYNLFTVDEAVKVRQNLDGVKSAVVVGGGFIGLETAEAFHKQGIKTAIVELAPQLAAGFDPEFSIPLERHLQEKGIDVKLGAALTAIHGSARVEEVELSNGDRIAADLVVVAIGSNPQLALAKNSGLRIGESGGLAVDATMQTSQPDIYAAGDIVESLHLVAKQMVRIPLAGSANKQGRVAGANAAGGKLLFKGVQGTSILKACDITLARTGLTEGQAKELGRKFFVCYSPSLHHAGYYPGARWMICKMVVEEFTGRILGAEIVGWEGVDKRIDVLATAIYAGLTVFDLENLDLAYAPPFGSARDPVFIAGMIASNVIRHEGRIITPRQLDDLRTAEDITILDCRTKEEYARGHIEGAIHMPLDELRSRYQELDPDKKVVTYCGIGYRAYLSFRFLLQKGFYVYNLTGGYASYTMSIPG